MKLVGQGRQYWTNVEKLMRLRHQKAIQIWDEMKLKLQEKYLPVSYKKRLLDQLQRLTQGNGPVSEYIKKFDQFLMRCCEDESDAKVLSRFRSGLKDELRRELIVRNISTLKQTIQVVQELDQFQVSFFLSRTDYRDNPNRNTVKYQPNQSQPQSYFGPSNSNPKREDKGKGITGESSRSIQQTQCFKC